MGIFDGVLLASDFDGTLSAGECGILGRVRTAIKEFIAEGGLFTVSTGRTYLGFHAYDPEIINAPVLLSNGGMLYDYEKREILALNGVGTEAIAALRAVQAGYPELSIEIYAFEDTCCINVHDKAHRHFTSQDIPYRVIDSPAQASYPAAKIMLGGKKEDVASVQEFLKRNHPEVGFIPTNGEYLEILQPGINKGSAVLMLAEKLGIKREDVYTAGDGDNDVDMLKIAAEAFVPANGAPEALECADYVVSSNTDGAIADAIEILKKKYGRGK